MKLMSSIFFGCGVGHELNIVHLVRGLTRWESDLCFFRCFFPTCLSVSSPSPSCPPPPSPRRPPPRRISTTILWVQCGMPDLNRDPVSSVWRAGPQPRAREFSVACRTPTAILRVQCGVPDPNRVPDLNCDPASSVWRAGPQPRAYSRWNQLGASCGWKHDAVPQHAGTSRRRLGSR